MVLATTAIDPFVVSPASACKEGRLLTSGHIDTWPFRRTVELDRFAFSTRSPLPLPHGFSYSGPVMALGTGYSNDDTDWVTITIHQVRASEAQELKAADAVASVVGFSKATEVDPAVDDRQALGAYCTVVEAVTPHASTKEADPEKPAIARTWQEDPLMRVLHVLRQLVRAERVAAEGRGPIPAYEQIVQPVFASKAQGEQLLENAEPEARAFATLTPEWPPPSLVMLEHPNLLLDRLDARFEGEQQDAKLRKWLIDLELDLPAVLWRERLADARQQFLGEGRYDLAVILCSTASEVLIDGLLQMLWWEKSKTDTAVSVNSVAAAFNASKDSVARMNKYLPVLLGGNWSAPHSAPQEWITKTWKLRHRCVHSGYYPTYEEAQNALSSSFDIATFMFDRLAANANKFPRVVLQVLAEGGLRKRNLWNQRIRNFAETDAQQESDWRIAIRDFRAQIETARA